ncbi:hypothetical protein [Mesorhizobium sp. M0684]|uniref:hypothetical protein n=1 Tax=Mesorhizobium sp. M0684 TaxID=2956986 RepID=UPI00333B3D4C
MIFAAGWHSMVVIISIAKAILRLEIGAAFCGIASHTLDASCRKSDAGRFGRRQFTTP